MASQGSSIGIQGQLDLKHVMSLRITGGRLGQSSFLGKGAVIRDKKSLTLPFRGFQSLSPSAGLWGWPPRKGSAAPRAPFWQRIQRRFWRRDLPAGEKLKHPHQITGPVLLKRIDRDVEDKRGSPQIILVQQPPRRFAFLRSLALLLLGAFLCRTFFPGQWKKLGVTASQKVESVVMRVASKVDKKLEALERKVDKVEASSRPTKLVLPGDDLEEEDDLMVLRRRLISAGLPAEARKQAMKELRRLRKTPAWSPEYGTKHNYLQMLAELPWNRSTRGGLVDMTTSKGTLDKEHYGLERVKKRIVEYLAVRELKRDAPTPILCFVGPPGVGKTSLARSVAAALERKFVRVTLGGVRDEAAIRGHRRTYVDSMPGRIMEGIKRAGVNNPVMLLDEIDKVGDDKYHGNPSAALLEVLDPEQNHSFTDHYLAVPFDLSQVVFVATANSTRPIPAPLLDRMEVIQLPGYTFDEKLNIAMKHLIPRQLKDHGVSEQELQVPEEMLGTVISRYTREAGVRNLSQHLAALCRATAVQVLEHKAAHMPPATQTESPAVTNPKAIEADFNALLSKLAESEVEGVSVEPKDAKGELDKKLIVTGSVETVEASEEHKDETALVLTGKAAEKQKKGSEGVQPLDVARVLEVLEKMGFHGQVKDINRIEEAGAIRYDVKMENSGPLVPLRRSSTRESVLLHRLAVARTRLEELQSALSQEETKPAFAELAREPKVTKSWWENVLRPGQKEGVSEQKSQSQSQKEEQGESTKAPVVGQGWRLRELKEEVRIAEGEVKLLERALERQLTEQARNFLRQRRVDYGALDEDDGLEEFEQRVSKSKADEVHKKAELNIPPMETLVVDETLLEKVLGPPRYEHGEVANRVSVPGVAMGLSAAEAGGEVLFVEVTAVPGKGRLHLTGQLGSVLKESAQIALTWVKSRLGTLQPSQLQGVLKPEEIRLSTEGLDFHIHFPEGAVGKEGPSAGVTLTTALSSLVTGRCVRDDTAMTGEVTLRGLVLPVGGIKEKVLAAHRVGIRRVIVPYYNAKDLQEIPKKVVDEMEFVLVKHVEEVLENAFHGGFQLPPIEESMKEAAHLSRKTQLPPVGGEVGGHSVGPPTDSNGVIVRTTYQM